MPNAPKPAHANPDDYLAALPPDRRAVLAEVRTLFRRCLDPTIAEGIQYGMIGYFIPHTVYPPGYHCDPRQPLPVAAIANQKHHLSMYLMCLYASPATRADFERDWTAAGKQLDMGKSCIRFKSLNDLAIPVLESALRRCTAMGYIQQYEVLLKASRSRPRPKR